MGETAAETARELELTRKALEDTVGKLVERAPEEAQDFIDTTGRKVAIVLGLIVAAVIVIRLIRR